MKQKKIIAYVLILTMISRVVYGSGFTLSAMAVESERAFGLESYEFTVGQDDKVDGSAAKVSTYAAVSIQQNDFAVSESELNVATGAAIISGVTVTVSDPEKNEQSGKTTYQLNFEGTLSSQDITKVYLYYQVKVSDNNVCYYIIGEMKVKKEDAPNETPAVEPSGSPIASPSGTPAVEPSGSPSASPSGTPAVEPSGSPIASPSGTPTVKPSGSPIASPSGTPAVEPSGSPIASPSGTPTVKPSGSPIASPSGTPTLSPTDKPTVSPSGTPTVPPVLIPTSPAIVDHTPEPSRQPVTVKKTVSVTLGQALTIGKIISDSSAFEKMTLFKAKKYHKYFLINSKTGKITTRKNYSVKIQKKIRVKVWVRGVEKPYSVLVKIKIPKPKVKIQVKRYHGNLGWNFLFKFRLKKNSRLRVRLVRGGTAEINHHFDKNISGWKSDKNSHIIFSSTGMKRRGKKLSFQVVAFYGKGKNQSQVLKITKRVKMK